MEGHPGHTGLQLIGHMDLTEHTASGGGDLHPVAVCQLLFGTVVGVKLDKVSGCGIVDGTGALGLGTGVVMVEHTAAHQGDGVFRILGLGRGNPLHGNQQTHPIVAGRAVDMENGGAGVVGCGTGPLAAGAANLVVGHTVVGGGDHTHFVENFLNAVVVGGVAQAGHHLAENLPVLLALALDGNGLPQQLDTALGVGKGAVLLQEGGAGQHHIRQGRGFGDKQVLHHHKGLFQGVGHMAAIGVGNHGVFAHDVQELHLVRKNRGDGLGDGIALLAAELYTPGLFKFLLDSGVEYLLIAGVVGGQRAHIAGTLDIVLTPQGVHAIAHTAQIAGDQGQIAQALDIVGAVQVLGDAHGIGDIGFVGGGIHSGGINNQLLIQAADFRHPLRGIGLDAFFQGFNALGVLGDVFLVLQTFRKNHMEHTVAQGHRGAGVDLQVDVGNVCQGNPLGVGNNQLLAGQLGLPHIHTHDRMGVGGVGAGDENHVRVQNLLNPVGHRAAAQGVGKAGDGGAVAQSGTVVHIVGAHGGTHELLEDVVVLVGGPGAGEARHCIGAVFCLHLLNFSANQVQGLLPGGRLQNTVFAD